MAPAIPPIAARIRRNGGVGRGLAWRRVRPGAPGHASAGPPDPVNAIIARLTLARLPGTEAAGPQWTMWAPAGMLPFLEPVGGSVSGTLTTRGATLTFANIEAISAR